MKRTWLIGFFILCLLPLLALGGCRQEAATAPTPVSVATAVPPTAAAPPVATPTILIPEVTQTVPPAPAATAEPVNVALSEMPKFAAYRKTAVDVIPAMVHEPIAPDLSNVVVPFALAPAQLARLGQDGVVVSPGVEKEFFTVYEKARYANVPIFVTSDSLLHSYHLIFDKVLRTAERDAFIPLLRELNAAMLATTDAQYQALRGTAWEEAALHSVAFIGAGSRLLDPAAAVPAYAEALVTAEVAQIEAAASIQPSPIFPGLENGEDYTQYIPRGHYTLSEELKSYFKSMMWYGRLTFRLKSNNPDVGRAETRSALLLVHALQTTQLSSGMSALDAWLDLYNPTAFMVGRSDDLTAFQYIDVINTVYGAGADLATIADEARLETFIASANELPPPRILGLVIAVSDDEALVTKGFRFMGQRFVPDAYIFRELIYRNVGTQQNPRMLPNGLDVMAAMGSERAYTLLDELGATAYANYPEQMAKMRAWTGGLSEEEWNETLYNGWLYTLQALLPVPGEGYPQFMRSNAWLDKQLSTSLGSWAELKHDTILYAKQVYAELGGGGDGPPLPKEALGYVEPVPEFYARLSALATMTHDGLQSRGLLSERDADSLLRLIQLVDAFQVMAEKELRGEPLDEGELHLIRFYGGELEHLVMAAADVEDDDPFAMPVMEEEPQAAVIADVATAPDPDGDGIPNPVALEVGVGRIDELYVVVPVIHSDGSVYLQVAKGGVFAYYEFPWPADDRLTDEKWRAMLDAGEAPARPSWISGFFTPETENAAIQRAVYSFQRGVTEFYWYRELPYNWTEAVAAPFRSDIEALQAANEYVGRQWITAGFRSFDLQAPDLAVVTVRETWEDTRYAQNNPWQESSDPVLATRGPYTLDVTYTVERIDDTWQVTRAVLNSAPPPWNE